MRKFKTTLALANKLEELFPNRYTCVKDLFGYNVACDVINYISKKSFQRYNTDNQFVEFGSRLLQLRHSGRASKILSKLKSEGILEAFLSPSTGKEHYLTTEKAIEVTGDKKARGYCKKLKLSKIYSLFSIYNSNNINLLSNNYSNIPPSLYSEVVELTYGQAVKRKSTSKLTTEQWKQYNDFKYTIEELDIDYDLLLEVAQKEVENVQIENFKQDDEIKADNFEVHFLSSNKKQWLTRESAIKSAKFNYETLIQDGKKYYVAGKAQFINYKKNNLTYSYLDNISRLEVGNYYCKRNNTNTRLDHNLTSMANPLTKEIMRQNNLKSIDLNNSQFAILAYIMDKKGYNTDDFNKFKEAAYKGTLYNETMELMDGTRAETKLAFFESLFSKTTSITERKTKLYKLYPTVGKYIDKYKSEGNYKDFSVFLQNEEAKIFIDKIYPVLKERLAWVLPKHDAFMVREEEQEIALEIMQEEFNKIGFKGTITIEN